MCEGEDHIEINIKSLQNMRNIQNKQMQCNQ